MEFEKRHRVYFITSITGMPWLGGGHRRSSRWLRRGTYPHGPWGGLR